MNKETGGQAFPCDSRESVQFAGMTLRDYFAAKVIQGDIAALSYSLQSHSAKEMLDRAEASYRMADAMLKAR